MSVRRGPLFTFNYSGGGEVSIRTVPAPGPECGFFAERGGGGESCSTPAAADPSRASRGASEPCSKVATLPTMRVCHCPSEIRRHDWNLSIAEDLNYFILMKELSRLVYAQLDSTRLSTAPTVTSDADC
jgi:hypothetical protein